MKLKTWILGIILIVSLSTSCRLFESGLRIRHTIDGDTIILNDGRHVRLIGINTAEMNYDSPRPPEPFALEAKDFVDSIATGKGCYLEFDPIGDKIDRYGRTLAFVFILPDSVFLNAEVIKRGYSKVFDRYAFRKDYKELFYELQYDARMGGKGIWK
ncbi:thermonuclease family protein [bacterium]|nr:thermonuclease family protein [bacterium]